MKAQEIREQVCAMGRKLVETKLLVGTWGNISARIDDKTMAITPSGRDYLELKAELRAVPTPRKIGTEEHRRHVEIRVCAGVEKRVKMRLLRRSVCRFVSVRVARPRQDVGSAFGFDAWINAGGKK